MERTIEFAECCFHEGWKCVIPVPPSPREILFGSRGRVIGCVNGKPKIIAQDTKGSI